MANPKISLISVAKKDIKEPYENFTYRVRDAFNYGIMPDGTTQKFGKDAPVNKLVVFSYKRDFSTQDIEIPVSEDTVEMINITSVTLGTPDDIKCRDEIIKLIHDHIASGSTADLNIYILGYYFELLMKYRRFQDYMKPEHRQPFEDNLKIWMDKWFPENNYPLPDVCVYC